VQFGGHCLVQHVTAFCFLAVPLPPPLAKAVVDNNAIAMMEKNTFFI